MQDDKTKPMRGMSEQLHEILSAFPPRLARELLHMEESHVGLSVRISELRVRAERSSSLTLDGKNIPLPIILTREEVARALQALCRGSVYAYAESLKEGYLTVGGGIRIGVAGRAVTEGGRINGISDISSLVIRLPRHVTGAGTAALSLFRRLSGGEGLLICALPGVGKTTALRDLAVLLSSGREARRVAIVDTRCEIDIGTFPRGCLIDCLTGYPKGIGLETAIRVLSPEAVLMDEIGGEEDAASILSVQYAGIPLIASAHVGAPSLIGKSSPLLRLIRAGVFRYALTISRCGGEYRHEETDLHSMQEAVHP